MEETYRTRGIILRRLPYRQSDLLVTVYTPDKGKLTLVARGAKKIQSKLAAHLEPFCLSEIMVVRGRAFDYIGSAISQNCFAALKSDLEKIGAAQKAIHDFNVAVKESLEEPAIFESLSSFLNQLQLKNIASASLLAASFILKLLCLLGYKPELYTCTTCGKKITSDDLKFGIEDQGLVCQDCRTGDKTLSVSADVIKLLRLTIDNEYKIIAKVRVSEEIEGEYIGFIKTIFDYNFR